MKRNMHGLWVGLLAVVALSGCRQSQPVAAEQQYPVRGRVIAVMPDKGEVLLDHENIPGFMEAMTMAYKMADPSILSELHPGDRITATLVAGRDAAGPKNIRLKQIVIIAQGRPDTKPKVQYHVPAPGDVVPDFPLLNQSGKTIRLSQMRGKVVLLTFIYTRCGMSEFCPKMSRNFAEIDKALAADPALYAKTHLLSISFDPEYDKPAVLRSYGGGYTGRYTKETFAHWDFAAPPVKDLPAMEKFFDLGVTGEGVSIQHSLATVVVGRDGKVVAFYPTSDWTISEVVKQIRDAA